MSAEIPSDLQAALAHRYELRRFLKEIEIAARLSHPHILALYDSGEPLIA